LISLDYLTFRQLSADTDLYSPDSLDQRLVERAGHAVRSGSLWTVRPAMKVFFDGCSFWIASHFNRYEAALRAGAVHAEFWCDIKRGTKGDAINFSKGATT
jgi:hypothetical protein